MFNTDTNIQRTAQAQSRKVAPTAKKFLLFHNYLLITRNPYKQTLFSPLLCWLQYVHSIFILLMTFN